MLSRRKFIGGAAALAIRARLPKSYGQSATVELRDIALINGRIHTMDANSRVVSQLLIRNGRIVTVGGATPAANATTRVIDLKGRTVVPGLVEAHIHVVAGWKSTRMEHTPRTRVHHPRCDRSIENASHGRSAWRDRFNDRADVCDAIP
jgi:predicted amidohydrolase